MATDAFPGNPAIHLTDPERALAVAYAPADRRPALATLFALDERLGAVIAGTTETGIGLIRLAWWREALAALDANPAPPEPLLAAVARTILPHGPSGAEVSGIEHGWSAMLAQPMDAAAIARFASHRGGGLFTLAGRLLGSDDPRLASSGEIWALADLAHRHSDEAVRAEARARGLRTLDVRPAGGWPKPARPLAALATLAARDLASETRQQGSPARVARMLALRLTGR